MSIHWDLKSKDLQANFGALKQAPEASSVRPSSNVSASKEKTKAPNEKNSKFENLLSQDTEPRAAKSDVKTKTTDTQNAPNKIKDKPNDLGKEKISAEAKLKENQSPSVRNTKLNRDDSQVNNSLDRLNPPDTKSLPSKNSQNDLSADMENRAENAVGFALPEQAKNLLQQSSVTQFLKGDLSGFDANSIVEFVSTNPFISKILSSETSSFITTPQPLEQILKDWGLDDSVIAAFEKIGLDKEQLTAPAQLLSILGLNAENVKGEIDKLKSALENGGLAGYISKASKQRARATESQNLNPTSKTEGSQTPSENTVTQTPTNFKESSNRVGNRKESVPTNLSTATPSVANPKQNTEVNPTQKPEINPGKAIAKTNTASQKSITNVSDLLNNIPQKSPEIQTEQFSISQTNTIKQPTEILSFKNLSSEDPFENFELKNKPIEGRLITVNLTDEIQAPASDLSLINTEIPEEAIPTTKSFSNTGVLNLLQNQLESKPNLNSLPENKNWFADSRTKESEILPLKQSEVSTMLNSNTNWMDQIQLKQIETKIDPNTTDSVASSDTMVLDITPKLERESQSFSDSNESFSNQKDSNLFELGNQANSFKVSNNTKVDFAQNLQNHNESMQKINQSVVENASMLIKEGGGSMQIDLKTPDLGELKLAINLDNKNLEVKILAENQSSRDLLAHEIPKLKEQLSQQNISLKELSVGVGASFDHQHSNQRHEQMKDTQNFIQSFGNNPATQKRMDLGSVYKNIQRNTNLNPFHNGRIQIAA